MTGAVRRTKRTSYNYPLSAVEVRARRTTIAFGLRKPDRRRTGAANTGHSRTDKRLCELLSVND
jgi:hypothetical protein